MAENELMSPEQAAAFKEKNLAAWADFMGKQEAIEQKYWLDVAVFREEAERLCEPYREELRAKLEPLYMAWNEQFAPGFMHDVPSVVVPGENPMSLIDASDFDENGKAKFNDLDQIVMQLNSEYAAKCAPVIAACKLKAAPIEQAAQAQLELLRGEHQAKIKAIRDEALAGA